MGATYSLATPCPREFRCKHCGHAVRVEERTDRRTVFCSPQCEREYWKHRDRYERKKDTAQGHVTTPSRDRFIMDRAF